MKVETFNSQLSKVLEYEFYALLANLNNVFAVISNRKSDNLCAAVVRSNEHTVKCVESNCSLLRVVYNDVVTARLTVAPETFNLASFTPFVSGQKPTFWRSEKRLSRKVAPENWSPSAFTRTD